MEVVERARARRDVATPTRRRPRGARGAAAAARPGAGRREPRPAAPAVVLIVGVNGTGKTTTIGKLAARERAAGRRVILAAADTFRAAASEQLRIWADRAGAEIVAHAAGADPAAVVFDALDAAVARGADVVIIDTAGRLHTKSNLMDELAKIRRVIDRRLPGATPETLLVLDATTGQNGLAQAVAFHEAVGLTGIVLTKLDSTSRGGIVFAIEQRLGVPVRFAGVGERPEDLVDFDPARVRRGAVRGRGVTAGAPRAQGRGAGRSLAVAVAGCLDAHRSIASAHASTRDARADTADDHVRARHHRLVRGPGHPRRQRHGDARPARRPGRGPAARSRTRARTTAELDAPTSCSSTDASRRRRRRASRKIPTVPGRGQSSSVLTYELQGVASVDSAVLQIGAAPSHVARVSPHRAAARPP